MTGKQLKEKIKQKGIKYAVLAERLGVVPQQVHQYFNTPNISTEVLERIADAIGESVSYFYNEQPVFTIEDYAKISKMEQEIMYLRLLVREKDRIIDLLMNKEEK